MTTVWPCGSDSRRSGVDTGTALIADWLLTAVARIVTAYTQPGQRVLLLAPAPHATRSAATASRSARWSRTSPYDGLLEAAWTVFRLGRGVRTETVVPPSETPPRHGLSAGPRTARGPRLESESGPGPRSSGPTGDRDRWPSTSNRPGTDGHGSDDGRRTPPDRFDLVVTAAEQHVLDWLRPVNWATVLTPSGALAVITHGDYAHGYFRDPASPLVAAAHHSGLRYGDRIALVREPVSDGSVTRFRPPHDPAATPTAVAPRHTQVHDDLFVFTTPPAAHGGEANAHD